MPKDETHGFGKEDIILQLRRNYGAVSRKKIAFRQHDTTYKITTVRTTITRHEHAKSHGTN